MIWTCGTIALVLSAICAFVIFCALSLASMVEDEQAEEAARLESLQSKIRRIGLSESKGSMDSSTTSAGDCDSGGDSEDS